MVAVPRLCNVDFRTIKPRIAKADWSSIEPSPGAQECWIDDITLGISAVVTGTAAIKAGAALFVVTANTRFATILFKKIFPYALFYGAHFLRGAEATGPTMPPILIRWAPAIKTTIERFIP